MVDFAYNKRTEGCDCSRNGYPELYRLQAGFKPSLSMVPFVSGPQKPEQVPQGVQDLFATSPLKVKSVVVVYEGETGDERVSVWQAVE